VFGNGLGVDVVVQVAAVSLERVVLGSVSAMGVRLVALRWVSVAFEVWGIPCVEVGGASDGCGRYLRRQWLWLVFLALGFRLLSRRARECDLVCPVVPSPVV
jgi:hypothetical protein